MVSVHATHIRIEGSVRRVRDSMFWPRMAIKLWECISKCDISLSHCASQGREPLLKHEIIDRPWAKVGADLCELRGCTLLVVYDYCSNYIEVENLHKTKYSALTKAMKILFARYKGYQTP